MPPFASSPNRARRFPCRNRRPFAWLAVALALLALALPCPFASGQNVPFRVGLSSTYFADLNEQDARTTMKAWAQAVARQRGVALQLEVVVLDSPATAARHVRAKTVDAVAVTLPEFAAVSGLATFHPIFVPVHGGKPKDRYGIYVRRDSGIAALADLAGRDLVCLGDTRAGLADAWLHLLLTGQNLPEPGKFFGPISSSLRASKTILPVYFKQRTACLATVSAYDALVKQNAQVGRDLRSIVVSEELVPTVMALRADFLPYLRDPLATTLENLHLFPEGQQLLTVLQGERLERHPPAFLADSLQLLERHATLPADPPVVIPPRPSP